MGLGRNVVPNSKTMKEKFLQKYRDYYQGDMKKYDIFIMSWKEEEPFEVYVERF